MVAYFTTFVHQARNISNKQQTPAKCTDFIMYDILQY